MKVKNENLLFRLVIISVLIFSLVSCGTKNKSERDSRREQIRNNAEMKREELQRVVGVYKGYVSTTDGSNQNVLLKLDIKDIPGNSDGKVDPVLIPTLSGFLKFTYSTKGINENGDTIGFEIKKAEYDPKRKTINLTLVNSKYEEVLLDLDKEEDSLKGLWTAPGLSLTGKINLIDQNSERGRRNLLPDNKIKGVYKGFFRWSSLSSYQPAQITISTKFVAPDNLSISSTVRLFFGDFNSSEYTTYHYEKVDFNPFKGIITMRDSSSNIQIEGSVLASSFKGRWFTDFTGDMGEIELKKNIIPPPPKDILSIKPLSGTYFGQLKNNGRTKLPEKILFSFVAAEDSNRPNGLTISGKLRLYPGAFGSVEYIELPMDHIEFNFFTRKIVAKTTGQYHLTLVGELTKNGIIGHFQYDALGKVAKFLVERGAPIPGSPKENIQGEYRGILNWDRNDWQQNSTFKIITHFEENIGLRISASAKLIFGPPDSTEYLTYNFPKVEYNPTTGQFIFMNKESEVSFVGYIENGMIEGVWKDKYLGEMGTIKFSKSKDLPTISKDHLAPALQGVYLGDLKNTNPQTNLPEKIFLGIVTGRDVRNPNSIKISGNLRFYLGPFDSLEYEEIPLENIRFNFFTREFIANTIGNYSFTIKGTIGVNGFVGNLYHDGPGKIANIKLKKNKTK